MLNFKPSNPPEALAFSSDDLEGMVDNTEESQDCDVSDDTDSDDDDINVSEMRLLEKSQENQINKRTLSSPAIISANCLIWRMKRRKVLKRKGRMFVSKV